MMKRKLLLAALAAASIGFTAVPATAATIYLDVAPPALRHEVVPGARQGYVWQPGFWQWRDGRHVWARGHWVRERKGYFWHPSRWEERDGRWGFQSGRWDRQRWADNRRGALGDRDRDGIPNVLDRADNRRGAGGDRDRDGVPDRVDRDRDGDGVSNRRDAAPDNRRVQ